MGNRMAFEQAKNRYVHRFTADHIPDWARQKADNGRYHAPGFSSDRDWYEKTIFPGEGNISSRSRFCESKPDFPFGKWLVEPFRKEDVTVVHAIETKDGTVLRFDDVLDEETLRHLKGKLESGTLTAHEVGTPDSLEHSGLDDFDQIEGHVIKALSVRNNTVNELDAQTAKRSVPRTLEATLKLKMGM